MWMYDLKGWSGGHDYMKKPWNQVWIGWLFFVLVQTLLAVVFGLMDRHGRDSYYTNLTHSTVGYLTILASFLVVSIGTWRLTRRFAHMVVRCCCFLVAIALPLLIGVVWVWACIFLYFGCAGHGM